MPTEAPASMQPTAKHKQQSPELKSPRSMYTSNKKLVAIHTIPLLCHTPSDEDVLSIQSAHCMVKTNHCETVLALPRPPQRGVLHADRHIRLLKHL